MSRAPTGRVTPSCSSTAAAIRWARGTPTLMRGCGPSASDDELVEPRIRGTVEAPGTILRPRIHAHGAPLPVLAGRAGPGQPVAAKRQARERRDVGQQRV